VIITLENLTNSFVLIPSRFVMRYLRVEIYRAFRVVY